jgi:hypothetical protein
MKKKGSEEKKNRKIQAGSDKSGIFNVFLENHTAELKIIQFYRSKQISRVKC